MNSFIKAITSKRMFAVLLQGFSSGLPLALTSSTLQAWLKDLNVDLKTIGIFSLVGIPYTLKFLWSPLLDRYSIPFLSLGRRRGWMLLIQVFLTLSIILLAMSTPTDSPKLFALIALSVAFFSASQDIVLDAYRAEVLHKDEFGVGSGVYILGYRIAMLVSGSLTLILADQTAIGLSWKQTYFAMAACMAIGALATLFGPKPLIEAKAPSTLSHAMFDPLKEFFSRKGSLEMVVFLLLYKLDVAMTLALTTPFLMELGFAKVDIGAVNKGIGMIAAIAGALVGGGVIMKIGLKNSLFLFGITQAIAGLSFMFLAKMGHHYPMMVFAVGAENFFSGAGNSAFAAFLMSLCDPRFTATQYALLSSLMALTRTLAGASSGFLITAFGWQGYYLMCALSGIPAMLLLFRYSKWKQAEASI